MWNSSSPPTRTISEFSSKSSGGGRGREVVSCQWSVVGFQLRVRDSEPVWCHPERSEGSRQFPPRRHGEDMLQAQWKQQGFFATLKSCRGRACPTLVGTSGNAGTASRPPTCAARGVKP